ncbi:OmpA family protein, partial [Methylobacterium frigidaeris]
PKDPAKDPAKDSAKDAGRDKAAETAAVAAMKAEIAKAVAPLSSGTPTPKVEVRRSGEGILISITDEIDFSMFGIGSAEPTPKVVRAIEKIAKVINSRPGRIVVRGHTDGRPFRSEAYDNWRLSTARAQMASYMLVRGGVDESRIERIEGYADRQPRNPADPKAAENRRIEILLRGLPE